MWETVFFPLVSGFNHWLFKESRDFEAAYYVIFSILLFLILFEV